MSLAQSTRNSVLTDPCLQRSLTLFANGPSRPLSLAFPRSRPTAASSMARRITDCPRLTVTPAQFFGLRRLYYSLVPETSLRSTARSRSDNPPWCKLT